MGELNTLARLMEAFVVVRQLLDHQNVEVPNLVALFRNDLAGVEDMGPVHSKLGLSELKEEVHDSCQSVLCFREENLVFESVHSCSLENYHN